MPPPPPPPPPKRGGAPLRPPGAALTSSAKRPSAVPIASSHASSPTNRLSASPPKTASANSTTEKTATGGSSSIAKASAIPRDATVTAPPAKPVVGTSQQDSSSSLAAAIPSNTNACNRAPNALASASPAPKKEGQNQQIPPCVAAAALFSQSAIACWRTEYLASLAMVAGQVGERLSQMGMGHKHIANKKQNPDKKPPITKPKTNESNETNDQKLSSSASVALNKQTDKARKRDTVAPGTRSAALRAKHLIARKKHRTASAITPSRLCSDLKRHYVSLLRGGLARAPEQPMATDGGACIGERLLMCATPRLSGGSRDADVSSLGSTNIGAAGGNAMSFRADDVALFNGPAYVLTAACSSAAPPSTTAGLQSPTMKAPIESLTKLVLEHQLTLKRLSVPPQPSATSFSALSMGSKRRGGSNSVGARRRKLVKLALVGRREIDRALKTSLGPDGAKHARKENGRRGQKKRRKNERARRTARK